ncbi:hypothetical protein HY626_04630 [Candidatus Uhrbacteria bacterium]|nr:hypothetical protein [Candidatus Uhrbacteria bacterium]
MSEIHKEAPPEAVKEKERKLNWHLTETSSGAWSVGTTLDDAGFYPADEETGTVDFWVAPADFVEKYLKDENEEHTDGAIRAAIEKWRDEQKG